MNTSTKINLLSWNDFEEGGIYAIYLNGEQIDAKFKVVSIKPYMETNKLIETKILENFNFEENGKTVGRLKKGQTDNIVASPSSSDKTRYYIKLN